jgi:hypothetical protein
MIRFLTYLSGTIAFLTVATLCHALVMYLIVHPMPFKLTVWIVGIIFIFQLLRKAVKGLIQSDWLEDSFKSKSIKE